MLLLGESKADYANMLAVHHDRPAVMNTEGLEIWTCNAGFRIWRHDLLFVMDDLEREAHRWPQYGADLAAHPGPIITSAGYAGWPNAIAYPFDAVCAKLHLQGYDRYFFNTVPYMLAYALFLGVKHVSIWGADYWHPAIGNAREGDIENAHWWLGFLRAKGVGVTIPNNSTLMGMRNAGRPLYGYRLDPRIEQDRAQLAAQQKEETANKLGKCEPGLSAGAQALINDQARPSNETQNENTRESRLSMPPGRVQVVD